MGNRTQEWHDGTAPPDTAEAREREIERLSRLYAALSHINRAIVFMPTRDELFRKICEVLVEQGGFRAAWIATQDEVTRALVPVAHAGDESGFRESVHAASDQRVDGDGPSEDAFREGRPFVRKDLPVGPVVPVMTSATDETKAGGHHRASAVFPFRENGRMAGTLNVYADQPEIFQDKEVTLLAEAAANLSFALDNLAREDERRRTEAIAERESGFAQSLIETMPGIFYLYDQQGRFLRWNRNFEHLSGRSGAEIANLRPLDFFRDEDAALVKRRVAEAFEKGESSLEVSFLAKDGTTTPCFFTGKRIQFNGATCLVGVGVDISERQYAENALRASEERYRSTLNNILEGCQLIAFDWSYLYLNGAAALQNRRPNEELLGRRMMDVWPGIEATPVFALLRTCMTRRVAQHRETEFVFPDGSTGWFDVRAQPVREGIFVLSIDISERKHAELTLRELNESLERKVAERTRDLEKARERAESADRLKSAFLATMSHELRTPLNSIIGFTGIILQGLAGPLNGEQSKQLGMVQVSARHLLELINDVLDISKIEAGQMTVQRAPFDLQTSLDRVAASVRPLAEKKGLSLAVVAPPALAPIDSDRRRVEQILLNLLSNAIKFTERGGVTLKTEAVDMAPTGGGAPRPAVRLQIADTGSGIKKEAFSLLFRPFHQLDGGLERQYEGTGLGLAICRRLTDLLGGTIGVESEWGQGSVFTVTLPIAPPEVSP